MPPPVSLPPRLPATLAAPWVPRAPCSRRPPCTGSPPSPNTGRPRFPAAPSQGSTLSALPQAPRAVLFGRSPPARPSARTAPESPGNRRLAPELRPRRSVLAVSATPAVAGPPQRSPAPASPIWLPRSVPTLTALQNFLDQGPAHPHGIHLVAPGTDLCPQTLQAGGPLR